MVVTHQPQAGPPERLQVCEPSLLFYARPLEHFFHNAPTEGSDFTCAALDFDGGASHPLARALPPLVVLPLGAVDGLQQSLDLLFAETDRLRCGHRVLADRLFEVVLLQLLRWLLDHPQQAQMPPGLLTGLADPQLSRTLTALHEAPGEPWSLAQMAQQAGMSRSAFAARFKAVVGDTPADYLAHWRLTLAQAHLRAGRSLKSIAHELGYANPRRCRACLRKSWGCQRGTGGRRWTKGVDTQPGQRRRGTQEPLAPVFKPKAADALVEYAPAAINYIANSHPPRAPPPRGASRLLRR